MGKRNRISLIIRCDGNYYKLVSAQRRKDKIVAYWGDNSIASALGVEEIHLTYPADGDIHFTSRFRNKPFGLRKFSGRIQLLDAHKNIVACDNLSHLETVSFPSLPLIHDSAKTPLDEVEILPLQLGTWVTRLPLNSGKFDPISPSKLTQKQQETAFILDGISGTLNASVILHKSTKNLYFPSKMTYILKDESSEPVISLILFVI